MSFKFGVFTFDLATKFMDVDTGVVALDAQDIYNAAQEWGAEPSNMIYDTVLTGGGKFALDALATKFTGLVVRMDKGDAPSPADSAWAVRFAAAAGPGIELRRVSGGDFISEDVSPVAPSAFTYIVIEQATSPTLVVSSSGLTEGDKDDIAARVWTRPLTSVPGSFGEWVQFKLLTVSKFLGLK